MFARTLTLLTTLLLCATASAELPPLRVEGNQILAGEKPIILRGVATGDPVSARQGRPASDDYATLAKDWNANTVRFGIHPGVWKHQDRQKTLDTLAREVEASLENNLYVIIDYHVIGWPGAGYQNPPVNGRGSDSYDSDMDLARSFWTAVADRFGKDGRIAFELWNEPAEFDPEGKSINSEAPEAWNRLQPLLQELVDIVRARSSNLIIGAGPRWAFDLRGVRENPLKGANIAYAWHLYAGHENNDPSRWAEKLDNLERDYPVLVTEWGFQRGSKAHYGGSPDDFGNQFQRDFLNARQLHWTAWCWHPSWGPPMLERDWRTPNEFGRFVQEALRSPAR